MNHTLMIHSLNAAHLILNGSRQVRMNAGMPLSVELICYLITFGERKLSTILNDVFANFEMHHARNYFHLIRYELQKTTMLEIAFDWQSKHYRLESRERLEWDVQHLRNAIRSGTVTHEDYGLFLPASSSAWVLRERTKLENDFAISAINDLNRLEANGRGEERKVLESLVRVLPMNERVLGFSVRHTARKVSREAATEQLETFKQRFSITGQMVPESLGTCMTLH